MPDDELTNALLTDYTTTARNLQTGVNVTQETMNKYHGMTGTLLAKCVTALWSQEELDEQIDKRVAAKCATCPNSATLLALKAQADDTGVGVVAKTLAVVRALTPWRWPFCIAAFSPFAGDFVTKIAAVFK